ncbi:MAG: branched-chain amino acid aminotransferase [Burkholderiaceae bacterium]
MSTTASQTFAVRPSATARTADARREAMASNPKFGDLFTDHMAVAQYTPEAGWHDFEVTALAPFSLHPASSVLQYGQSIFEGLKAYAVPDGGIALFRPGMNARRFAKSAQRMAMPELPEAHFLSALEALVTVERDWVPTASGTSLYLRPMMFARDARLITKPSTRYTFAVIACPVGNYFPNGVEPVTVWISHDYIRAARGGTGEAKFAGNYAASFAAQAEAAAHGCDQVVWLDAIDRNTIEEMGGMNLYFVTKRDGRITLVTPQASGSLLRGVTRDSLVTLAADLGYGFEERQITVDEWREGCRTGVITEAFACGTAAVIVPIGRAKSSVGDDIVVNGGESGPVAMGLRERLLAIQHGFEPDRHGWMVRVGTA